MTYTTTDTESADGSAMPATLLATAETNGSAWRGVILRRHVDGDPDRRYYLYLPRGDIKGAPVLVAMHGISRNAEEHIRSFAPLAEQFGVVLIAPLFEHGRYPDYQRLGREGRGERADLALDAILDDVHSLTNIPTGRFFLFGFSGGAQFAHRYAFAYPERIVAMALAAAGWYTFPDSRRRFPHGIRTSPRLPDMSFDAVRLLTVPACVFVGDRDIERDAALNRSEKIDRRQGRTRVERARRWVRAMTDEARAHGLGTPYFVDLLPDTGHSFSRSVVRGAIVSRVFCFLFGSRSLRTAGFPTVSADDIARDDVYRPAGVHGEVRTAP